MLFAGAPATRQDVQAAWKTLKVFDLVGRTDNLSAFAVNMGIVLAYNWLLHKDLPHAHGNVTHKYELTKTQRKWIKRNNQGDLWLYMHAPATAVPSRALVLSKTGHKAGCVALQSHNRPIPPHPPPTLPPPPPPPPPTLLGLADFFNL